LKKKRILYLMQSTGFSVDAAQTQLEKLLASPGFARNERMSRFLRFLVERNLKGQDSELKETLIAIQVFGRKPDYDPQLDSIVRTEAIRLRARLAEYYSREGSADAIVIELPKGGYVPLISSVEGTTKVTASSRSRLGKWLWIAIAAGVVLMVAATTAFVLGRERVPVKIAVLPLENLGHDAADDYFVDGLTGRDHPKSVSDRWPFRPLPDLILCVSWQAA
jgi:hypothetical protein